MKIVVRNIRTPISVSEKEVKEEAIRRLSSVIDRGSVIGTAVYRRSVDVRHRKISFVYSVLVEIQTSVTEEDISGALYTQESGDPDMIVRTGGDLRISNFLLWQAA